MATLTGFTRPADPINAQELSEQITTAMGSACIATVVNSSSVTVEGDSISESNRTAIQTVITDYIPSSSDVAVTDATISITDITTNNASTSKHGFFPKLPTSAGKFLKDDLTWETIAGGGDLLSTNNLSDLANASTARTNLGLGTLATQSGTFSGSSSGTNTGDQTLPTDETISTTDVTTNNATTSKHGWFPKLPTATGLYLKDDLTWGNPSGSAYTLVATLAGDATTGANTTPIDLTDLVWSYAANSKYLFRFIGEVLPAATTTGCGFQLNVSSAVTSMNIFFAHQLANTGTLSGGSARADDASIGVSSGMASASVPTTVSGDGILITGANTGTAQLRFRSETTAVTVAKAGLTLIVEKIA